MVASMPGSQGDSNWGNTMSLDTPHPIIPETLRSAVGLGEMGVHGTPIFGGIISDDFNQKFADLRSGLRIYDEMRRTDGTVQATLLGMELPILQCEWYIEPTSQDPVDLQIAQKIGWNLFEGTSNSFKDLLRQGLGMHWAGFSLFEKVFEWKRYGKDNFVGWKKFAQRLAPTVNRWDFDETGGPRGVFQLASTSSHEQYIPIWKLLLFTNRKEGGNVQGMSFLRPAYKHWYMKDKLYRLQAIGLERDVVGVPYIKLPPSAGAKDRQKAEEIVRSLRRDENAGLTFKNTWDLALLQGSTGAKDTTAMNVIQHHDMKIAQSMLAQFINLGEASRGAYALAVPLGDLMTQAQTAQADYIAETITKYVIRPIVELNWPGRRVPTLGHGDIRKKDMRQMSLILNALTAAGLLDTSPEVLAYVRRFFGFPEAATNLDQNSFNEVQRQPTPPDDFNEPPPDPNTDAAANRPVVTAPNNAPDALEQAFAQVPQIRDEFVFNDALAALREAQSILDANQRDSVAAGTYYSS